LYGFICQAPKIRMDDSLRKKEHWKVADEKRITRLEMESFEKTRPQEEGSAIGCDRISGLSDAALHYRSTGSCVFGKAASACVVRREFARTGGSRVFEV